MTPSFISLPSTLFYIIVVPAEDNAPPRDSAPIIIPTFADVEKVTPPTPPAIIPPANEMGAAIAPPAAPIPEEIPHFL